MKSWIVAAAFALNLLVVPGARAQEELPIVEIDPPVEPLDEVAFGWGFFGGGVAMLGAGVGLNALVFTHVDEAIFDSTTGEAGVGLAIPPVLTAGGIVLMATGLTSVLGGDVETSLRVGGVAGLLAAVAGLVATIYVAEDETRGIGNFGSERAAVYLGLNTGASLLLGAGVLAISFGVDEE